MSFDPQQFLQYINFQSWNAKEDINRKIHPDYSSIKLFKICERADFEKVNAGYIFDKYEKYRKNGLICMNNSSNYKIYSSFS